MQGSHPSTSPRWSRSSAWRAINGAELFFMNPVKSRGAIARAYRDFGVRSFAFDSDDELDKIVDETGGANDVDLYLRVACPNTHSLIPLEGKFGVSSEDAPALLLRARQIARPARAHLPCRLAGGCSRRVRRGDAADRPTHRHVRRPGRCHRYRRRLSEPLSAFRSAGACELHGRGGARRRRACGQALLRVHSASRGARSWPRPSW